MTDVAALGLRVDSRDMERGAANLRRLRGEAERTERAADELGDEFQRTGRRIDRSTQQSSAAMAALGSSARALRTQLVAIGGALAGAFGAGAGINAIANFGDRMGSVAAVSRATGSQLQELRDVAKEMGATTEFSASQAAEGLQFLAMAGLSADQAVAALPRTLDLATAANLGLGRSADIVSNIMTAFGIAAEDVGNAADVLAGTAARSNTNVEQIGQAMKFVGTVAANFDVSLSDAAAAVGTLGDAGIQASMAGTGLRRILSSLANPTGAAEKALASLGLTVEDVNPRTNRLTEIVDTLASSGLSASEALEIFGDRGGPAILALVENRGRLSELTGELQNVTGEAERMAEVMRDDLRGDLQAVQSAAEAVVIELGDAGATGVLRRFAQAAAGGLRALANNIDTVIAAAQAAAIALTAAFGPAILNAVRTLSVALSVNLVGSLRAVAMAHPFTAIASAITAAIGLVWSFRDEIQQAIGVDVVKIVKTAADAIKGMFDAILDVIEKIKQELNNLGNSSVFKRLNQWLDARGLLSKPEGVKVIDESLSTSSGGMTAEAAERMLSQRRQRLEGDLTLAMRRRQMGIIHSDDEQVRESEREIRRLQGLLDGMAGSSGEKVAQLRDRFKEVGEEINTLSLKVASGNASGLGAMKSRLEELNAELSRMIGQYRQLTGGMELPWVADEYRGVAAAPPGIGATGSAATGIDGSMDVLRRRMAHGRVRLEGLDQAAADAAAAVLSDPRFANIMVTSAIRSKEYNASIPGAAKRSRHIPEFGGDAIDFAGIRDDEQRRALALALRDAGFTGFGTYEGQHIHADMGPRRFWAKGQAPGWWDQFAQGGGAGGGADAEAVRETTEALRKQNEVMALGEAIRERNATAMERLVQGLKQASAALQAGAIDHETYNRELERLQGSYQDAIAEANRLPKELQSTEQAAQQAAQSIGGMLVGTLFQIAEGGQNAEDALKRLAMQLAQMTVMGALFGSGPLGQVFGGGLIGGFSANATGNVVGPNGPIPLRAYSRGGIADSPHLAMFGEGSKPEAFVPLPDGRTIPVSIQAPKMPAMSGGGGTNVTVVDQRSGNAPPVQQQRRRRADGGEDVRLVIRDASIAANREDIAQGGALADTLERTYGLTRRMP